MRYLAVVGSFQTPYLSKKMHELFQLYSEHGYSLLILMRVSSACSLNNPLTYEERLLLFKDLLNHNKINTTIIPITDCKDDRIWSESIDQVLDRYSQISVVHIIVEDHVSDKYIGNYRLPGVSSCPTLFDSNENETIRTPFNNYLSGVHFARSNEKYGKLHVTVDIVVRKRDCILLGKKATESKYRLPGGFVNINDKSREAAARRELMEETGLIAEGSMILIDDVIINDWRYTHPNETVMTSLFVTLYSCGIPTAGDDLAGTQLEWVPNDQALDRVEDTHKPLIVAYLNFLKSL